MFSLLVRLWVFAAAFFNVSCSHLGYGLEQGFGQLRLMNRARAVEEVLNSPYTSSKTRQMILEVGKAKHFAVTTLGLRATGNYRNYVEVDGRAVVNIVTAADPLRLQAKLWRFPIVGEVPYLGYFSKSSADRLARELMAEGLDVYQRGAAAFSSLGWFPDPLYSSIIDGANVRDIADLVIHESLHATVWIGDSVDFNESLANFVGGQGSLLYLRSQGLEAEVAPAQADDEYERRFAKFIETEIERYKKEVNSLAEKQEFYGVLASRWQTAAPKGSKRYPDFSKWNNATLLAHGVYYKGFEELSAVLQRCGGNLQRFIAWFVAEKNNKNGLLSSAPFERVKQMANESCPSAFQ